MISKYMLVSIFFINITINAMEQTCYLALLPAEIHNYIASYLSFDTIESDDEFIDRTRTFGMISEEHCFQILWMTAPCALCDIQDNYGFSDVGTITSSREACRTYSVDRSKIISLELAEEPKVTIFDIHKQTIHESARFAELLKANIDIIEHIAFSRTCSLYAAQYKVCCEEGVCGPYGGNGRSYIRKFIAIKNILSDERQEFLIPDQYDDFISIGFNKQGTKIIVHAKENGYWDDVLSQEDKPVSFYHIIPLTSPEEHEEKSKKTLEAYLRYIGCCKDLVSN